MPIPAGLAALLPSPARLLLLPLPQAGRRLATGVPPPLATEWDGEEARLLACAALKRWAWGEAARLALLLLRLLDRSAAANVLGRPSSDGARPRGAMGSGGCIGPGAGGASGCTGDCGADVRACSGCRVAGDCGAEPRCCWRSAGDCGADERAGRASGAGVGTPPRAPALSSDWLLRVRTAGRMAISSAKSCPACSRAAAGGGEAAGVAGSACAAPCAVAAVPAAGSCSAGCSAALLCCCGCRSSTGAGAAAVATGLAGPEAPAWVGFLARLMGSGSGSCCTVRGPAGGCAGCCWGCSRGDGWPDAVPRPGDLGGCWRRRATAKLRCMASRSPPKKWCGEASGRAGASAAAIAPGWAAAWAPVAVVRGVVGAEPELQRTWAVGLLAGTKPPAAGGGQGQGQGGAKVQEEQRPRRMQAHTSAKAGKQSFTPANRTP